MKRVYTSDNYLLVGHLRQVLEANGIRCVLRNDLLGGAGEIPVMECWPEIWVEPLQHERAEALVRAMLAIDMDTHDPWRCPDCGEAHEGQFSSCWRCGRARSFQD